MSTANEIARNILTLAQRQLDRENIQGALILIDEAQNLLLRQTPIEITLKLERRHAEVETLVSIAR